MSLTAADFLRLALTVFLAVLAYGRLPILLRWLLPGRIRHRALPAVPEPPGALAAALRRAGFKYLGARAEDVLRLHRHEAAVYAHPDGRLFDLPPEGRLLGAYCLTLYQGGRAALTRVGGGREVVVDRYRSVPLGVRATLQDLLQAHAESAAAVSLGEPALPAATLEERIERARAWYRDHGAAEFQVPALLDGLLLLALVAFTIYLWLV